MYGPGTNVPGPPAGRKRCMFAAGNGVVVHKRYTGSPVIAASEFTGKRRRHGTLVAENANSACQERGS